jgi:hypothetical protein
LILFAWFTPSPTHLSPSSSTYICSPFPLFFLSSSLHWTLKGFCLPLHSWCYPPSRSTNFPINNQKRHTENARAR